jgi:hypothetical protein
MTEETTPQPQPTAIRTSDIMHVPAVNKHYPFDHELDEMVLRVQEWAVALDDEVRQMQLADPKAKGGE